MVSDAHEPAGLRWTGHALIDAGIAGLTNFAKRQRPEAVTLGDLDGFVDFAERFYLSADLSKTLGILFTINVKFLNPTVKGDERKREAIRETAGAFRRAPGSSGGQCAYCGRGAVTILHRDGIPMLLGRSIVNFYPGGQPGLPICGLCQTCLQGLTLAAPRVSGRALVVQADEPQLTVRLVRRWVDETVRYAQLAQQGIEAPKLSMPRTRLVEALVAAQNEMDQREGDTGLVAYSLSNSGQGPGIDVYTLPSSIVGFLKKARTQRTAAAWGEIEHRAWQQARRGQSAADAPTEERAQHQNYLYEDLFRLPEESGRFIRIYFLRNAAGLVRAGDPRAGYRSIQEANLVNWDLTELFLEEVLSMEQARIDAIRSLGDRLAEEIVSENDRRLFQRTYRARDYWMVRRLLLDASFRRLNRNEAPVLTLADYLDVFEEGEELARTDWRLAWDLVLIRLIEQLYASDWLRQHKDVLEDAVQNEEDAGAEAVS